MQTYPLKKGSVTILSIGVGVASLFASSGSWAYTSDDILNDPTRLFDKDLSKDELVSHLLESDGEFKKLSENVIQHSTEQICRDHYIAELCR